MELSTHEIKTHKTLAALAALCCVLLLTLFLLVYKVMSSQSPVVATSAISHLDVSLAPDEIAANNAGPLKSNGQNKHELQRPATASVPVQTAEHSEVAHLTQSYAAHRGNPVVPNTGPAEADEPGGLTATTTGPTSAIRGIGIELSGRSVIHQPAFTSETNEQGTVVVSITVNAKGQVIEAEPGARGTTTSSAALRKRSRELAMSTRFNEVPGDHEQRGTITIVYTFNQ